MWGNTFVWWFLVYLLHFCLYLEIICYDFMIMTACSTHMYFLNSDAPLSRTLLAFWPYAILYQHVLTFITAHRCLRQFAHPVKTVFLHKVHKYCYARCELCGHKWLILFWRFSSSLPSHQMALPFEDNTVLSLTQVFSGLGNSTIKRKSTAVAVIGGINLTSLTKWAGLERRGRHPRGHSVLHCTDHLPMSNVSWNCEKFIGFKLLCDIQGSVSILVFL